MEQVKPMKSPITGLPMEYKTRPHTIHFRGEDHPITFHYYLDSDGREYTTFELDELNIGQVYNKYPDMIPKRVLRKCLLRSMNYSKLYVLCEDKPKQGEWGMCVMTGDHFKVKTIVGDKYIGEDGYEYPMVPMTATVINRVIGSNNPKLELPGIHPDVVKKYHPIFEQVIQVSFVEATARYDDGSIEPVGDYYPEIEGEYLKIQI